MMNIRKVFIKPFLNYRGLEQFPRQTSLFNDFTFVNYILSMVKLLIFK